MGRYLVLAMVLTAAGCSRPAAGDPPGPPAGGGPERPREDALGLYECVLRHQLKGYPAEVKAFLAVEDADPPADLLDRLRKDWPNLRPASEDPKREGLRVYAQDLRWEQDTAVVKAGHWVATKIGAEARFADHHVVRKGGRWVVKKVTNITTT